MQNKMPTILHVVDAFTNVPFSGNPAAVCILESAADECWMQNVAKEMNLAETAFVWPIADGYSLRWFTPAIEVDLCGHATLASAFALWDNKKLAIDTVAKFFTRSGWLTCTKKSEWIEMNFPALESVPSEVPEVLESAIGCKPIAFCKSSMDYLVEVPNEKTLRELKVNMNLLATIPTRGVIVTCKAETAEFDFISRFFAPAAGVDEDPVTGSAHCALGPYWKRKLHKDKFKAFQASKRGGVVQLELTGDRVVLSGQAVLMSRVELFH